MASGHIGSNETFWFDQLAYQLLHTQATRVEAPEAGIREVLPRSTPQRREVYGRIVGILKSVPDQVRIAALEKIHAQCGVREDQSVAGLSRPLDAEQLVHASRNGLSVQSHTVTHPILAHVDAQRLQMELAGSRQALGEITGVMPSVLAYPNGTWSDFGQREVDAAKRCGYDAAVTYEPGIQSRDDFDPFRLLRLAVNWRHSRGWFKAMLAVPEVATGPADLGPAHAS